MDYALARQHMVDSQIRTADVTDPDLIRAFRTVPREAFVPANACARAYSDRPIAYAADAQDEVRWMMPPRDLAKLIQAADFLKTDVVLEIGCGRGYATAIIASVADTVIGLETSASMVERATEELIKAEVTNAAVLEADLRAGAPEHGPYDVIFVNGAIAEVSQNWFKQLAPKGRIVAIVQNGPMGRATVFTTEGGQVGTRVVFDASVPLLSGFEALPAFVL